MDFYSFKKFERIDNAQSVEDSCPNSPTHIPFPPPQLLGLVSHGNESNSREKKKDNLDFSEGFRSLCLHSGLWLVREQGILNTGWLSLCFIKIKESIEDKEIIFTMKNPQRIEDKPHPSDHHIPPALPPVSDQLAWGIWESPHSALYLAKMFRHTRIKKHHRGRGLLRLLYITTEIWNQKWYDRLAISWTCSPFVPSPNRDACSAPSPKNESNYKKYIYSANETPKSVAKT